MSDQYEDLSKEQLVALLRKADGRKKLGLVWERDEIEADRAVDADFVSCAIDEALSDGPGPWPNLVIEGDNFDALRWLRMTHARRVKCIYVDPPYNTGAKDWVYNDHYVGKTDRWRQSTWLEFLYRRLTLARDLLAPDGVMLISINDEQRAKLELLCDEVMPGMRVGSFAWRTRIGGNEGSETFFSTNHEHVLVFANSGFRFGGLEKTFAMYSNPDEDPLGDWRRSDLTVAVAYSNPRAGKAFYPLHDPETDIWYPCNPDRVWVFASRERSGAKARIKTKFMEDWVKSRRIVFPENPEIAVWETRAELDAAISSRQVPISGRAPLLRPDLPDLDFWIGKRVGFGTPAFKRYKKDLKNATQPLSSWIIPRAEANTVEPGANMIVSGTNDEGAKTIKEIFGQKAFNYAKPASLIREVVRQATGPGDIVLDFFAGSATTAQAVMELNAEDGGDRQFIMISSTEATDAEPAKNICRDVTAERVRRLNARADGKYADLHAPFAYLRTREIAFEDLDYDLPPAEAWAALEALHGLPLTRHDPALGWQEHERDGAVLLFAERCDAALGDRLAALRASRADITVYAWAPGQVAVLAPDLDVRPVRQTLVRRFQQCANRSIRWRGTSAKRWTRWRARSRRSRGASTRARPSAAPSPCGTARCCWKRPRDRARR